jgi:hypothetical protein
MSTALLERDAEHAQLMAGARVLSLPRRVLHLRRRRCCVTG